ncbi:flagellar export chaperone FlgN [Seleniivibrio woodruffii]|uniref:FlgN protein n=1 Tax=Seleniivibrio woodruffii TaxID=1078050 RepID=A0A4R1KBZ7_9BACT|nr:flagellar export chaperone FlgN [Seleniivibrio woodruffii]TCK62108.1 FlgN protein [Seleniivibrio woodruffii]TVZ34775.1 FlgN protein [Seleniivibrio woodruffii]
MENIKALLEIMDSQKKLYNEMLSVLQEEKEAAIRWDSARTNELAKTKDTLTYKEKFINEAFVNCIKKIEKEHGLEGLRVEIIARELAGEHSTELMAVRNELVSLTKKVNDANTSLKILFKTNMTMIEGLFQKLGVAGRNTYGISKQFNTGKTSTICQTG